MSPEAKDAVDALAALIGGAGLSGIAIAIVGWLQAKRQHAAHPQTHPPTLGRLAMSQIGGLMVNDHAADALARALDRLALAEERGTAAREAGSRQTRDGAETLHADLRNLTDAVETLARRMAEHAP